ncbi:Acid-sensing ion channel 3 [Amphibalanus amphitrite]|uniref:Acid-sensing ion channel 3 n=1 Tax=Amphibalanus amphitrite TaxID=1232801 RepID=A0A6A4VCB5_AMPAM|nr:Acid-sensing ion channel 3 [Amphibalanus amphitrite]
MLVKSSLSLVQVVPGTVSYVRVHRRSHTHISTAEEPCSDNVTAEENAECVMDCIIHDQGLTAELAQSGNDTSGDEDVDDREIANCTLPWESSDDRRPCRSYSALRSALKSSPDLSQFTESEVMSAYFLCSCPFQCTEISYPIQVPEKMALEDSVDSRRSARVALWLSMQQEALEDKWSFTFSQLVAESGGNMGIFLGASLLSLLELLDFFIFWMLRRVGARGPADANPAQAKPSQTSVNIAVRYQGKVEGIRRQSWGGLK